MTSTEQQRTWLALLEAELTCRTARVRWDADEGERQRQWFLEELRQMAQRFAVTASLYPLRTADMSIAEKLACRYFLPEALQPAGLGTEDEIWAEYQSARLSSRSGKA
jgi:hypothetical protein